MVGGSVVREHSPTADSLLREPAERTGQEANGRRLLIIGEYLHLGQASGVVDRDVHLFVTGATG